MLAGCTRFFDPPVAAGASFVVPGSSSGGGVGTGAAIGIAVGAALGGLILGGALVWAVRRR